MIGNFRIKDVVILTLAALFLGVFMALQFSIIKPSSGNFQSTEVMAVEIEKLAKNNAVLKSQVTDLTKKYQSYKESLGNQSQLDEQINKESRELEIINSVAAVTGQGVVIEISGRMSEAQIVDLVNAIKNIGADAIAINDCRISLYSTLGQSQFFAPYTVEVVGNGSIVESALIRKGGIVEQLRDKGLNVSLNKVSEINLPATPATTFKYANIESN